jgi:hypothetical protein
VAESMPTEQAVEFQQALRDQQTAVLESVQVSYTELMSASSRSERDRLLLYTLVGFGVGVGNSAAVSLVPTSVPYWILNLGFALTLLFFCTIYFISLRGDERRLVAARDLKTFYAGERFKEVMQIVTKGIDPKELEPNWLATQDTMAQSRTDDLFSLEENSSGMDAVTLRNAQVQIYERYEEKGFKDINNTQRALIIERVSQQKLAALADNYAEAVLIGPAAYLRVSRLIAYFPIVLALICVAFLITRLLARILQTS